MSRIPMSDDFDLDDLEEDYYEGEPHVLDFDDETRLDNEFQKTLEEQLDDVLDEIEAREETDGDGEATITFLSLQEISSELEAIVDDLETGDACHSEE